MRIKTNNEFTERTDNNLRRAGRKLAVFFAATLMALSLMACGTSEEVMQEVTQAMGDLHLARQSAEETYLDITDESAKSEIDELGKKVDELDKLEFEKIGDKKIKETYLPEINELTLKYGDLGADLTGILNEENEERTELSKHTEKKVYFVNKTGKNLSSIVLHDITRDTYSDNYIGDGVTIQDGYTLMGAVLDIYEDSSEWEFIVTDEADTQHSIPAGNLKSLGDDISSVELTLEPASDKAEG